VLSAIITSVNNHIIMELTNPLFETPYSVMRKDESEGGKTEERAIMYLTSINSIPEDCCDNDAEENDNSPVCPSIIDINILISDLFTYNKKFLHADSSENVQKAVTNIVPVITSNNNELLSDVIVPKKLKCDTGTLKRVKFAEGTIFCERNLNSLFWKEMEERRMKRRLIKEQRRLRRERQIAASNKKSASSSLSIVDILRLVFAFKKPRSKNSMTSEAITTTSSYSDVITVDHHLQTISDNDRDNNNVCKEDDAFTSVLTVPSPEINNASSTKLQRAMKSMNFRLGLNSGKNNQSHKQSEPKFSTLSSKHPTRNV